MTASRNPREPMLLLGALSALVVGLGGLVTPTRHTAEHLS